MAPIIQFRRIPLFFIFDAPQSVIGKIYERAVGGMVPTVIGTIADKAAVMPALSKIAGPLKNKIIIPMLVNPTTLSIAKTPNINITLTKRGVLNQYWKSNPDILTFTGRAAGDRAFFILSQIDVMMKTMEEGIRNLVTMVYKFGGVYRGYYENFRMSIDGEKPGIYDYSFDFRFADRNHFRLFLYAIRPSALNEAIQNPGKFVTENLKIAASELASTTGISLRKQKI